MPDPEALLAGARAGDPRAIARLISLVENASPQLRKIMQAIAPHAGHAHVIGLTGAPGVGKSTITARMVRCYRDKQLRVGVLAVDPTSPFSGGALLGDRVRMQDHATDDQVFIRSMATRGHLGGLAWATPQALRILDAAGFDVVLVETVGVGQAEVEVAGLTDCAIVVVAPGLGDSIQAAKAGILEIADIFAVNKSDRPGAQEVVRDLRTMLSMARYGQDDSPAPDQHPRGSGGRPPDKHPRGSGGRPPDKHPRGSGGRPPDKHLRGSGGRPPDKHWKPPIISTAAATGEGIADLVAAIDSHAAWLDRSGQRDRRRRARAREEITAIAVAELRQRMGGLPGESRLEDLAARVTAGQTDPYTAADELIGA